MLNVVTQENGSRPDGVAFALESLRERLQDFGTDATVEMSTGWVTLRTEFRCVPEVLLTEQFGRPGLWKPHIARGQMAQQRVFEVPETILARGRAQHEETKGDDALREFADWALATAGGEAPAGWNPPATDVIESWLPRESLTLQSGSILRQGNLIHEPDRLAITFPIMSTATAAAPKQHAEWLYELLVEAQNRIRMLRIGTTADGAVQTELDLTGAPEALLEPMLRAGMDALRWCVHRLVPCVELLVDDRMTCRALELCSPRA